jgi:pimeloyl-ACP methyl ester carboxylesterase
VAEFYHRCRHGYPDEAIDALTEAFGLTARDLVADLGCGTGQLTLPVAGRVRAVAGIDPPDGRAGAYRSGRVGAQASHDARGAQMERTVQTADGRTLAVQENGDLDGIPVMVHMGTPNSRHLYGPNSADAAGRGLRLISYDRPGYGGSTPSPGRTHADCAADARAICAALGIDRLAMWGISGGGPHALACAALLPDLVVAAASLASPAPFGADGLDWFAGMGQDNVDDFTLLRTDEVAARAKLEKEWGVFSVVSAGELAAGLASLLTPTDAAALTGGLAEYLAFGMHEGLAPGAEGWWEDGIAEAGPWGFDPAQISVPILVVHGKQDRFVPFSHGEWLAAHVPGAEPWLLDDDGHLTLLTRRIGEVHAWLADRMKS